MTTRMSLITRFAETAGDGPAIHITPGELFKVGEFSITNSMVYGALSSLIILFVLIRIARTMTPRPKRGLTQFIEIGTEFIISTIQNSMRSRKLAIKYAPFFVSAFFFVMFSNWLGMIPGGGETITYDGNPIIRPFTADLNGTLAASLIMMILVQFFAIRESGPVKYLRHFFAGSLKNPATYLLGVFEMFSEITKIFSLALRLFLNVAIGEAIIAIFAYLGGYIGSLTTLPILILELFVGALQAYIFTMLTIMYLAAAIHHEHEAEELERVLAAKEEAA